jgi:type V secretory pathway adhesin AidA
MAAVPMILLTACGGGSSGPTMSQDGWLVLFDGSSFDHFNVVGDANWRIEDGSVMADESTGASFLVTPDSYANFELELEFWVDTEANSGIFLRCQDPMNITDTSCYEANIYDTRADQTYRTGGIVNVAEPAEFVYTGGQWNRYEITADGSRLQITLNGRDLVDVEDTQFSTGPIALQYGAGTVRFRNVRVRSL